MSSSKPLPSENEAETERIQSGVRQILFRLSPIIRSSGNVSNLNDVLDTEVDVSPDLELAQWVKSVVEAEAGSLIEAEIERECPKNVAMTPEEMQRTAPIILDRVVSAANFQTAVDSMKRRLAAVCVDLTCDMDVEIPLISMRPFSRCESNDSLGSSSASWASSSKNYLLQPAEFARLGEKLNRFGPLENRLDALNAILALIQVGAGGDVLAASEAIREGLKWATADPSTADFALKLHAKLLLNQGPVGVSSPYSVKVAHGSLVGGIFCIFGDKPRSLPTTTSGVLFKRKKTHAVLLKAFALLAKANTELAKYWLRFPEKYVDEIVALTFELLAFEPGPKVLSPRQLLAIVDPNADWFFNWTHSQFGRNAVKGYEMAVTRPCKAYIKSRLDSEWPLSPLKRNSAKAKGAVLEPLIQLTYFCFSLRMVTRSLAYSKVDKADEDLLKLLASLALKKTAPSSVPQRYIAENLTHLISKRKFLPNDAFATIKSFSEDTSRPTIALENALAFASALERDEADSLEDFLLSVFESHQSHQQQLLIQSLRLAEKNSKTLRIQGSLKALIVTMTEVALELQDTRTATSQFTDQLKVTLRKIAFDSVWTLEAICEVEGGLDVVLHDLETASEHENFCLLSLLSEGQRLLMKERFVERLLRDLVDVLESEGDFRRWPGPTSREAEHLMRSKADLLVQLLQPQLLREYEDETLLKAVLTFRNISSASECVSAFAPKLLTGLIADLDTLALLTSPRFALLENVRRELDDGLECVDRRNTYLKLIKASASNVGFEFRAFDANNFSGQFEVAVSLTSKSISPMKIEAKQIRENLLKGQKFQVNSKLLIDAVKLEKAAFDDDPIETPSSPDSSFDFGQVQALWLQAYGEHLGLLQPSSSTHLSYIMNKSSILGGVCFLICKGQLRETERTLKAFECHQTAAFINPQSESVRLFVAHWLNVLTQEESPEIAAVLKEQKLSFGLIGSRWIRSCFINVLEWPKICDFLTLCAAFGADFALYFAIAVLKSKRKCILNRALKVEEEEQFSLLEELFLVSSAKETFFVCEFRELEEMKRKFRDKLTAHFRLLTRRDE